MVFLERKLSSLSTDYASIVPETATHILLDTNTTHKNPIFSNVLLSYFVAYYKNPIMADKCSFWFSTVSNFVELSQLTHPFKFNLMHDFQLVLIEIKTPSWCFIGKSNPLKLHF